MEERRNVRSALLESLLDPLISEWGVDSVRNAIDKIVASNSGADEPSLMGKAGRGRTKKPSSKPTAVEIVSRMKVAQEKHGVLEHLAAKYDTKQFLATAADIRHFFEDQGLSPPVVKHRSDAFRKIASVLGELSQNSLELISTSHSYTGPSQLGPLSSAIRKTGATLREGPNDSVETEKPSPEVLNIKSDKQ